jgi:predicted dehydrogenase
MVRVAIVGAGGIAAGHMKNIDRNEQAQLVAICDIVKDNAEKAAAQYGAKSYTDFDAMLHRPYRYGLYSSTGQPFQS